MSHLTATARRSRSPTPGSSSPPPRSAGFSSRSSACPPSGPPTTTALASASPSSRPSPGPTRPPWPSALAAAVALRFASAFPQPPPGHESCRSLCVSQPEHQPADKECGRGPAGEDADAAPGADGQVVQASGVLDGESGVHRRVSLDPVLPFRVAGQDGDDERGQVEQAEDDADGGRGVPDDGGKAEAEQRYQGEVEDRAGRCPQHRPVARRQRREAAGGGEAVAGQDD